MLLPLRLRLLLHLTTSHWREGPDVSQALTSQVNEMRADGWWVRGAWPRNYALWQHGTTMRNLRRPLLVLPLVYGRSSILDQNVFMAVEIVQAEDWLRTASRGRLSHSARSKLNELIERMTMGSAVSVVDPFRVHQEVAEELERILWR